MLECEKVVNCMMLEGVGSKVLDLREVCKGCKGDIEFLQGVDLMMDMVEGLQPFGKMAEEGYREVKEVIDMETMIRKLEHMGSAEALELFPDFRARKRVLLALRYINDEDTAELKGRAAVNVTTNESLILTEAVFKGVLDVLNPMEIAAVCSSLIFQDRRAPEDLGGLLEGAKDAVEAIKNIAVELAIAQQDGGIETVVEDFVGEYLKFGLATVTYEWACGVPFVEICRLTEVQEGTIVRTLVRLDEVLRELGKIAKVTGDAILFEKAEEASILIKRDICFCSSLYLS